MPTDFLDEMIAERTKRNQEFPKLMAEATTRRKLAQKYADHRESLDLSQTVVAARMGTSPSVVSKLEAGGDVKMSTFQRYLAAIGMKFEALGGQTISSSRGRAARGPRAR